jgi:hypothetical protein
MPFVVRVRPVGKGADVETEVDELDVVVLVVLVDEVVDVLLLVELVVELVVGLAVEDVRLDEPGSALPHRPNPARQSVPQ